MALSEAGASPVPFRVALAAATPAVVLVAVRKPVRPPVADGVKVVTTEQAAPEARVVPQLEEPSAKSLAADPEIASDRPARATPPGLETVTVWPALWTPTVVSGKLREEGVRLSEAGASPTPETGTETAGTPTLVLETTIVPDWLPGVVGVKVMGTPQVPPAARMAPQLPEPALNGAATAKDSPLRGPVPGFFTVSCKAVLLVPTGTCPKANWAGVTANCAAAKPVPARPTTRGTMAALEDCKAPVMVTLPLRVPGWLGAKETVNVQADALDRLTPQVLEGRL